MCWANWTKRGPALFIRLFLVFWVSEGSGYHGGETRERVDGWGWLSGEKKDESSPCLDVIVVGVEGNGQIKGDRLKGGHLFCYIIGHTWRREYFSFGTTFMWRFFSNLVCSTFFLVGCFYGLILKVGGYKVARLLSEGITIKGARVWMLRSVLIKIIHWRGLSWEREDLYKLIIKKAYSDINSKFLIYLKKRVGYVEKFFNFFCGSCYLLTISWQLWKLKFKRWWL